MKLKDYTFSTYIKRVKKTIPGQFIDRPISKAIIAKVEEGSKPEEEKKELKMKKAEEKVKDLFPLDLGEFDKKYVSKSINDGYKKDQSSFGLKTGNTFNILPSREESKEEKVPPETQHINMASFTVGTKHPMIKYVNEIIACITKTWNHANGSNVNYSPTEKRFRDHLLGAVQHWTDGEAKANGVIKDPNTMSYDWKKIVLYFYKNRNEIAHNEEYNYAWESYIGFVDSWNSR